MTAVFEIEVDSTVSGHEMLKMKMQKQVSRNHSDCLKRMPNF
jgi:hypothetical protein